LQSRILALILPISWKNRDYLNDQRINRLLVSKVARKLTSVYYYQHSSTPNPLYLLSVHATLVATSLLFSGRTDNKSLGRYLSNRALYCLNTIFIILRRNYNDTDANTLLNMT